MQVDFNLSSGRFSVLNSEMPATFLRGCVAWVSFRYQEKNGLIKAALRGPGCSENNQAVMDIHGRGSQRMIHSSVENGKLGLTLRINLYEDRPFLLLQLSIHNFAAVPIYLKEACLLQSDLSNGGLVQVDSSSGGQRFFKVGWHGWDFTGLRGPNQRNSDSWIDRLTSNSYSNPVVAKLSERGDFCSEGWGILVGSEACIIAGQVSTAHQFGQVYACTRAGETGLRLITQLDGIRLDPGESSDSEWAFLQFARVSEPEPEGEYIQAVARQMQARVPSVPPPPMWTHWYQYFHNISEQLFIENLAELVERHELIPYQVVELDDGYQSAWGDWTSTNHKFPHGLEWLSGQIIARGLNPGLWLAPFSVEKKSVVAREHPDWLVKGSTGKPANTGFVYNMFIHALDLTHPAVLDHLKELVHSLSHVWGYKMLKVDFLNAAALSGRRFNPKQTRAEALRAGLEAIRQGAGEETFLLGSGCPFGPAIGVVDAMRIGPDTAPSWEPYFHWLPWVSPLTKKNPSMPSLRNALRNTINLSSLHMRWWWNDPDCLLARDLNSRKEGSPDLPHLTDAEVQSAVSLVGLSGGMLVSSDDLHLVSPARLRWISCLVPNLGLHGRAVDLFYHELPSVYMVEQQAAGQRWKLVVLLNWSDQPADLRLSFTDLGYAPEARLHVFDFWAEHYSFSADYELVYAGVPAHGCKLLRVCEVENRVHLLGDTLHISMGSEIKIMRIANGTLMIETVDMGRRVVGKLWLRLEDVPKTAFCNGAAISVNDCGDGIYTLDLAFAEKGRVEILL